MTESCEPSRPRETFNIAFAYEQKELPGKTIVGLHCTYPPDGWTPPHTHKNGSISVYTLSGCYRKILNDEPFEYYVAGKSAYESPDDHVGIAENPSKTEPCVFFFTEVIDTAVWKRDGVDALWKLD